MAIKGTFYVFTRVSVLERGKKFFGDGYLVLHQDKSDPRKAAGMHVSVKADDVDAQHAALYTLSDSNRSEPAITVLAESAWRGI
jgi:hypothetical protein